LEDFGQCPQKFLLKHLLDVQDLEQPERELQISPRDKGTYDHEILERFYSNTPRAELEQAMATLPHLPQSIESRLETLIDERFDTLERERPVFNRTVRTIERAATKRLLREFLIADLADLDAKELLPVRFEYRFGRKHGERADHPEPFVVRTGELEVRVEGTVDRIDSDRSGKRLRIVDYKSGKAIRHRGLSGKIDRGVRLQLPLYAMAVQEIFEVDAGGVSGAIKPLVVEGLRSEKYEFELNEKRALLLDTLAVFVRAVMEGRFPAFPSDDDEIGSCKYCPVNHSCRTRHDELEAREVRRSGDARTLLSGEQS
jgi:ATP-dependent helicase/DNAse subunit B